MTQIEIFVRYFFVYLTFYLVKLPSIVLLCWTTHSLDVVNPVYSQASTLSVSTT